MGFFSNWLEQKWKTQEETYGGYTREEIGKLAYQSDHGDAQARAVIRKLNSECGLDFKEYNCIRKEVYLPLAESGNADAQYWMGLLNMDNANESRRWYVKAAEQGHVEAMKTIGRKHGKVSNRMNDEFPGFGYDPEQEIYWYQKAADAGDADAMCYIAMSYQAGDGLPEDAEKAFEWYQKAAAKNYGKAYLALGRIYTSPIDGHYDLSAALQCFEKAAESGEADLIVDAAMQMAYIYGGCYLFGGEPSTYSDANAALYWLFQAFVLEDEGRDDMTKGYIAKICNAAGNNIPSEKVQQEWIQEAKRRVQ